MRKLKFHERKLLKKVDFLQARVCVWRGGRAASDHVARVCCSRLAAAAPPPRALSARRRSPLTRACRPRTPRYALQWKNEHNLREVQTMRRYHIQDRDDYKKYNKLCGMVTKLVRARAHAAAAQQRHGRGARLYAARAAALVPPAGLAHDTNPKPSPPCHPVAGVRAAANGPARLHPHRAHRRAAGEALQLRRHPQPQKPGALRQAFHVLVLPVRTRVGAE
jgi:hypothetical protein